jgi:hypothetical protein
MLFLDLDLDFFLNKNTYSGSYTDGGRPGIEYQPWPESKVRRFLEDRCGLSRRNPLPGCTVATHDGVLEFWRALTASGRFKIPFGVVHVDAHPDLFVGDMMYLESGFLYIDFERGRETLKKKPVHAGNYLTFALAYGWINSLIWVHLLEDSKRPPEWDADARSELLRLKKQSEAGYHLRESPDATKERRVRFSILPWNKFRTSEAFDYIALSKSPDFTPAESDKLISVIEGYMKQA